MKVTKKMREARIYRAIVGFQIPLMAITKLYSQLENAIAEGKSDDDLRAIVAQEVANGK
jgi:hypothetical protein